MKDLNNKMFRILAVDDESTVRELYQGILKTNSSSQGIPNFNLTCCSQGDEAVEAVQRSFEEKAPYAVAFLDMNMPPGPDGDWTAEEIHKLDPRINTVLVTGYRIGNSVDSSDRGRFSDNLLYLQKPFHPRSTYEFANTSDSTWTANRWRSQAGGGRLVGAGELLSAMPSCPDVALLRRLVPASACREGVQAPSRLLVSGRRSCALRRQPGSWTPATRIANSGTWL